MDLTISPAIFSIFLLIDGLSAPPLPINHPSDVTIEWKKYEPFVLYCLRATLPCHLTGFMKIFADEVESLLKDVTPSLALTWTKTELQPNSTSDFSLDSSTDFSLILIS